MPPESGRRAPATSASAANDDCAQSGEMEALLGQIERLTAHLADCQHTIQCKHARRELTRGALPTSVHFISASSRSLQYSLLIY